MDRERGYSLHDFGVLPSHRHDESSDGLLTNARNLAGAPDSRIKRVLLTRKYKHSNVYNDIGIRVTGGKRLSHGELGAFVSAVNRSKAYEHLGEIKEGDQVLEWNGILLRNKTFEEVERIINSATGEIEVILKSHEGKRTRANRKRNENLYDNVSDVIARNSSYNVAAAFSPKEAPPVPAHRPLDMETDPSPLRTRTHPSSMHLTRRHNRVERDGPGYLQVAVSYDQLNYMLRVTCLSARSLKCRDYDGNVVLPNPFVKIYLLPGRKVSNKRRTKYISSTADPEWQQTVDYVIGYEELGGHYLEFTVWDYDKYHDDICLGMAVLNLQDTSIDGIPRWLPLKPPDHMPTARSNIPAAAAPSIYGNYGYNPANLDIGYPAIA